MTASTLTPSQIEKKRYSPPQILLVAAPQDLTLAYRFSSALVLVSAIAAAVGVFHAGVFHDVAMTAGNAQGTDLVILAVAIPTVVVSMILTARGSLRAQLVWLGALGYILYNSVFYAYAAHFNALFLVYAATLALSFWSVVVLLMKLDVDRLRHNFTPDTPVRIIAGYLVITILLFATLWLKDIIPAVLNNTVPSGLKGTGMVTNPIQMTDLAFGFPLTVLSAFWLWQRRAWGYVLAGAFLVYDVIESVSVATDQIFGHISDPGASLGAVPILVALTIVGLVPAVVYLRHLHGGSKSKHSLQEARL
jgi:hypothetical protein